MDPLEASPSIYTPEDRENLKNHIHNWLEEHVTRANSPSRKADMLHIYLARRIIRGLRVKNYSDEDLVTHDLFKEFYPIIYEVIGTTPCVECEPDTAKNILASFGKYLRIYLYHVTHDVLKYFDLGYQGIDGIVRCPVSKCFPRGIVLQEHVIAAKQPYQHIPEERREAALIMFQRTAKLYGTCDGSFRCEFEVDTREMDRSLVVTLEKFDNVTSPYPTLSTLYEVRALGDMLLNALQAALYQEYPDKKVLISGEICVPNNVR